MRFLRKIFVAATTVAFLSGCAGTMDAVVQTATGQGPFANKSLVASFLMSIDYVDQAAKEYTKGLKAVQQAGLIKDAAVAARAQKFAASMEGKHGVAGADVMNASASDIKAINEEVAKNMNATEWSKLTPAAQKKLQSAYLNFVSGNYYNTQLVAGAVHIARNMSTTALQSEVLPVVSGKYKGLTLEKLTEFPNTLRKFSDNIDESKKVTDSIEKTHDFSEAKKQRQAQLTAQSESSSKSYDKQFPDKSVGKSSDPLGGLGGGGLSLPGSSSPKK